MLARLAHTAQVATYALLLVAGCAALIVPPQTVAAQIGSGWLTMLWAVLMLGGSAVCLIATMRRAWLIEHTALPLAIAGGAIYAATVISMIPTSPSRLTQSAIVTAAVVYGVIRWADLRTATRAIAQEEDHGDIR